MLAPAFPAALSASAWGGLDDTRKGPRHQPQTGRKGGGPSPRRPRFRQLPLDSAARCGDVHQALATGSPDRGLETDGGTSICNEAGGKKTDDAGIVTRVSMLVSGSPAEPVRLGRTDVDCEYKWRDHLKAPGYRSCHPAIQKSHCKAAELTVGKA